MEKNESKTSKKKYEKAVLKSFSLVVDEVMAAGCKSTLSNPTGNIGGAVPCQGAGCNNNGS